jgi:hypothetical protein
MRKKTLLILIAIACLLIATAHAGWVYLVPDYNWFGYLDGRGVLSRIPLLWSMSVSLMNPPGGSCATRTNMIQRAKRIKRVLATVRMMGP